jgi:hypothetical protein
MNFNVKTEWTTYFGSQKRATEALTSVSLSQSEVNAIVKYLKENTIIESMSEDGVKLKEGYTVIDCKDGACAVSSDTTTYPNDRDAMKAVFIDAIHLFLTGPWDFDDHPFRVFARRPVLIASSLVGKGVLFNLENGISDIDTAFTELCTSTEIMRRSRTTLIDLTLCYLNQLGYNDSTLKRAIFESGSEIAQVAFERNEE